MPHPSAPTARQVPVHLPDSRPYDLWPPEFQTWLARAAHRAGRAAWLEEFRGAGPDHPALLTLPESSYLKCAFVRVA